MESVAFDASSKCSMQLRGDVKGIRANIAVPQHPTLEMAEPFRSKALEPNVIIHEANEPNTPCGLGFRSGSSWVDQGI